MKFSIITLFPEIVRAYSSESILKRAAERGLLSVESVNPREFTANRHRKVDDRPYGGGPGMVLQAEPIFRAVLYAARRAKKKPRVILLSPAGAQFDAAMARRYARGRSAVVLVAGHYEGIDERLRKMLKDERFLVEEVSIGPYVVTGGELPALVIADAIARQIPGVLGKGESREEARHGVGVPAYTRPEVIAWKRKKYRVPGVLRGGDHALIEAWRRAHARKFGSTPRLRR
ncbi:MAG: tRNA (guanosine(37)-N1)-methyltransferase TrmD [bacterium]|nr:tRNA (guanosine(37)-N1)-methyltransferase TrmD [bacterium]